MKSSVGVEVGNNHNSLSRKSLNFAYKINSSPGTTQQGITGGHRDSPDVGFEEV
jgi:hypothetical protein